ncbi:MAG TPA: class I SAM-dependent methyltransferase [Roseiflexaceae bacterium]|nr:class I SAM-dependent methyltransferase [Roseiflexaceae bacterium]
MSEQRWSVEQVVDASTPATVVRSYLEQAAVRRYLEYASARLNLGCAADIGAGYGRLSLVLAERAAQVVCCEREPGLVDLARRLLPAPLDVRQIETLARLPLPERSCQFVLVFTVLQHLTDADLPAVAAELLRIVDHPGYLLLCEETDETLRLLPDGTAGATTGRPVAAYQELLRPLVLVETAPRTVEPTYPRAHPGTYMLFRSPEA